MRLNEIKWIIHPKINVIIHGNDVDDSGNNDDEALISTSEHTLLYKTLFFSCHSFLI